MQRLHLIELEDLPWFPRPIRDGGTDLLDVLFARMRFYRPLAPKLRALMDATQTSTLMDVCSGGGGGALAMLGELDAAGRRDIDLVLSDRYPNEAAIERIRALGDPRVRYHREPTDALEAPAKEDAIRTMFGALHHFRPPQVRQILQRAVDANAPIAIFDVAASPALRKLPLALAPLAALPNLAILFIAALALVPLARPFRVTRLLLSYGVPLIPALFAWDGTVSALRAYLPEELLSLARSLDGAGRYDWECERQGPSLALIGRPRAASPLREHDPDASVQ